MNYETNLPSLQCCSPTVNTFKKFLLRSSFKGFWFLLIFIWTTLRGFVKLLLFDIGWLIFPILAQKCHNSPNYIKVHLFCRQNRISPRTVTWNASTCKLITLFCWTFFISKNFRFEDYLPPTILAVFWACLRFFQIVNWWTGNLGSVGGAIAISATTR